jgi:hypothetical protein
VVTKFNKWLLSDAPALAFRCAAKPSVRYQERSRMNKDPKEIMNELHLKFDSNFKEWSSVDSAKLDKPFSGLQCIAAIGEILGERKGSKHHEICCMVYDEIFSDGVSAIYLASNAMDKPASIVLRRVLELGVAAIYLWDMPHMAFSWNNHDQDLSFAEMLKHVNSKGYISYINKENDKEITAEIIPSSRAQSIYGSLSDVVHGKIATFESSMPDRFKFVTKEWNEFIALADEIIDILVWAFILRFNISSELFIKVPQARKEYS